MDGEQKTNATKNPLMASPQPLLIDADEVGRLLGRSVASVWRDDAEGRIPASVTIGGSRKWRLKELRSWVKAGLPERAVWEAGDGKRWARMPRDMT